MADARTDARIRVAAIELFGGQGIRATTIRQVAAAAGVSPGLVMHHFGSKEGLRKACDEWIINEISHDKQALARGDLTALRRLAASMQSLAPYMDYITASLREGGPGADHLFDMMCALTRTVLDAGVDSGTMRPPADEEAAIAVLVAISCGVAAFGDQIARTLGGTTLLDPQVYGRYAGAITDLYLHGIITDATFADNINDAFVDTPDSNDLPETPETKDAP